MGHVLRAIAESSAATQLVLRGSALMCGWFGETARPPKDLDFVVIPANLSMQDSRAVALLASIVTAVTSRSCPVAELRPEEVAQEQIWTYGRVPGTRVVFRWTADDMPWGATQLDFVFGERMPVAHETLDVVLDGGPPAKLQIAPKDLSLAWKLLWLHSDMHPRGKDLYDAMLLAETTPLPSHLLHAVFEIAESRPPQRDQLTDFYHRQLEWIGFEQQDDATVEAWKVRLARALRTSVANGGEENE